MQRFLPWTVVLVFLVYVTAALLPLPSSRDHFDLAAFGRLPAALNGRVQPIDSVARLGLLQITGSVTVPRDSAPGWKFWGRARRVGATEWLLEVLMKPDAADARRLFRIDDPKLLSALHINTADQRRTSYSFKDLEPALEEIGKQTGRIAKIEPKNRAPWERECVGLRNAIVIYERLKNSVQPNTFLQSEARGKPIDYDFAARLATYTADLRSGVSRAIAREHGSQQALDAGTTERLRMFARPYVGVSRSALLAVIPPVGEAGSVERWQSVGAAIIGSARTGQLPTPLGYYAAMSSAVAQGKPAAFKENITKYEQWLEARGLAADARRARSEYFFNGFQPFARAVAVYLVAFVLIGLAWKTRSTTLHRAAGLLLVLACVLHTIGLVFALLTDGGRPVTDTYALIMFAGWAIVAMAGVYGWFRGSGIGLMAAALAGPATLAAAHNLTIGGARLLMQTALGLSLWLAIAATALVLYFGSRSDARTHRLRSGEGATRQRKVSHLLGGNRAGRVSLTPR